MRQTTVRSPTTAGESAPPVARRAGRACVRHVATPLRLESDVWTGAVSHTEWTFHQLSPYIGKTKSSMASTLVQEFTQPGDTVYEPFSGCGSIAFESWVAGCNVVANDLSPYARLLTQAKLFPYQSHDQALGDLRRASGAVAQAPRPDLRAVPKWVRQFFHSETLREILVWTAVLVGRCADGRECFRTRSCSRPRPDANRSRSTVRLAWIGRARTAWIRYRSAPMASRPDNREWDGTPTTTTRTAC